MTTTTPLTAIPALRLPSLAPAVAVSPHAMAEPLDFGSFYQDHMTQLVRTLTATLGDPALAQDAAQESMARACERWAKIGSYDNPTGWCYRVAMNWATSRWRKRRREVMDFTDAQPSTENLASAALDDALVAALLRLPIDQREVVVLRLVQDWSIAETAEALGIAAGTVQSRYSRALTRLRRDLEHAYD